jgi:hypothetical protein
VVLLFGSWIRDFQLLTVRSKRKKRKVGSYKRDIELWVPYSEIIFLAEQILIL